MPAPARTTVCCSAFGVQAKPTRGDTLLVSVLMVRRNCKSYRTPAFSVKLDVIFHSSCAYMPTLGFLCAITIVPKVCVYPALLYAPLRKFSSVENVYAPRIDRG